VVTCAGQTTLTLTHCAVHDVWLLSIVMYVVLLFACFTINKTVNNCIIMTRRVLTCLSCMSVTLVCLRDSTLVQ